MRTTIEVANLLTQRDYDGARKYVDENEMFDKAGQLRLIDEQYKTNTRFDQDLKEDKFRFGVEQYDFGQKVEQETTADALSIIQADSLADSREGNTAGIMESMQNVMNNPNFDDKQKAATIATMTTMLDQAATTSIADRRTQTIAARDEKIQSYLGQRDQVFDKYKLDYKKIQAGDQKYLDSLPYEARRAVEGLQELREQNGIGEYEDQNALMEQQAAELAEQLQISPSKALELTRAGFDKAYNDVNQLNAQDKATYERQSAAIQKRLDKNPLYEKDMPVEERMEKVLQATGA